MKKLWYLVMAFGLVACQAEKVDVDGGAAGESKYLSVNIMTANGGLTRANNDYTGDYEDGDESEYDVNKIVFYFFDKNGNPVTVDFQNNRSFKEAVKKDITTENDGSVNVTKKTNALVIIQTKGNANLPYQTLVVVNGNENLGDRPNLTELIQKKNNGGVASLTSSEDGFVMSNSVYASSSGEPKDAVIIDGKLYSDQTVAEKNPVDIYVERAVAKVSVNSKLSAVSDMEDVYDTQKTDRDGKNIYVKFLGWNVTTTADQSFLVKNVNAKWPNSINDNNLFQTANQPWSYENFFRSYWAINPEGLQFQYGNFNQKNATPNVDGNENPAQANSLGRGYVYVQENAGQAAGEAPDYALAANKTPTQVIVAAQLLDEQQKPLELAEFAGQLFVDKKSDTEELNYITIKDYILAQLQTKYVTLTKEDDPITAREISRGDIKIVSAQEAGKGSNGGRYYVYAQLSGNGDWYKQSPDENVNSSTLDKWKTDNKVSANDVNAALSAIGSAKIWKDGYTYYYFEIRHLADPGSVGDISKPTSSKTTDNKEDWEKFENAAKKVPGYYGVVRNHVYKCDITSLAGLGTPVYNPNEIIIPEKTEEGEAFLYARINVLSWRIVDQSYDLVW